MGARKTKGTKTKPWPEITRQRIRAAMIEKHLMKHLHGEVELSKSQVAVGLGLLKKVLPDLSSVTHSGEDGGPIKAVIEWKQDE